MGLAASQARLLFISNRQNDVSANMQRLSNQTMILARDSDDVAARYHSMSNATKFVPVDDEVTITSDMLIGSQAYEKGKPYIISDPADSNRVILSESIASALGLSDSGTEAQFRNKFSSLEVFRASLEPVLNGTVKEGSIAADATRWINEILPSFKTQNGSYPTLKFGDQAAELVKDLKIANVNGNGTWSLADILSGKVATDVEIASDGDASGVPGDAAAAKCEAIARSMASLIAAKYNIPAVTSELNKYVDSIKSQMKNWEMGSGYGGTGATTNSNGDTEYKASEVARSWATSTKGWSDNDHAAMNMQKLLQRMIEIARAKASGTVQRSNLDSFSNLTVNEKGCTISDWEKRLKTTFGQAGFSKNYTYELALKAAKGEYAKANETDTNYKYCRDLYNNLKNNGWKTQSEDSITENISNGSYFINGAVPSSTGLFKEVPDEEVRNRAQSYYDMAMAKINSKEKQIERDMTKLQTEYNSLTNDYNSVKAIIDSNVQRSFTFFQNG